MYNNRSFKYDQLLIIAIRLIIKERKISADDLLRRIFTDLDISVKVRIINVQILSDCVIRRNQELFD